MWFDRAHARMIIIIRKEMFLHHGTKGVGEKVNIVFLLGEDESLVLNHLHDALQNRQQYFPICIRIQI